MCPSFYNFVYEVIHLLQILNTIIYIFKMDPVCSLLSSNKRYSFIRSNFKYVKLSTIADLFRCFGLTKAQHSDDNFHSVFPV